MSADIRSFQEAYRRLAAAPQHERTVDGERRVTFQKALFEQLKDLEESPSEAELGKRLRKAVDTFWKPAAPGDAKLIIVGVADRAKKQDVQRLFSGCLGFHSVGWVNLQPEGPVTFGLPKDKQRNRLPRADSEEDEDVSDGVSSSVDLSGLRPRALVIFQSGIAASAAAAARRGSRASPYADEVELFVERAATPSKNAAAQGALDVPQVAYDFVDAFLRLDAGPHRRSLSYALHLTVQWADYPLKEKVLDLCLARSVEQLQEAESAEPRSCILSIFGLPQEAHAKDLFWLFSGCPGFRFVSSGWPDPLDGRPQYFVHFRDTFAAEAGMWTRFRTKWCSSGVVEKEIFLDFWNGEVNMEGHTLPQLDLANAMACQGGFASRRRLKIDSARDDWAGQKLVLATSPQYEIADMSVGKLPPIKTRLGKLQVILEEWAEHHELDAAMFATGVKMSKPELPAEARLHKLSAALSSVMAQRAGSLRYHPLVVQAKTILWMEEARLELCKKLSEAQRLDGSGEDLQILIAEAKRLGVDPRRVDKAEKLARLRPLKSEKLTPQALGILQNLADMVAAHERGEKGQFKAATAELLNAAIEAALHAGVPEHHKVLTAVYQLIEDVEVEQLRSDSKRERRLQEEKQRRAMERQQKRKSAYSGDMKKPAHLAWLQDEENPFETFDEAFGAERRAQMPEPSVELWAKTDGAALSRAKAAAEERLARALQKKDRKTAREAAAFRQAFQVASERSLEKAKLRIGEWQGEQLMREMAAVELERAAAREEETRRREEEVERQRVAAAMAAQEQFQRDQETARKRREMEDHEAALDMAVG
eukprot:TRINITY_DN34464_c0_g1_i1.p1 TRINITY_DN34464_c0_g1~~TRINITY_DN34464_c0_g1_i1.p1  ORF type:complete len:821 (+),score=250.35 TRINITY_DN34464_c0_g1_i1:221-2683(+)